MKTMRYTLRFNTPAFLGNASQNAQWRTPPIKAQLRQWWRVAMTQQVKYNADSLRQRENDLFGMAANGGDSQQSLIRIRLNHWNMGQLKDWPRHGTLPHPEVPAPVGSDLYLGFGPLEYNRDNRSTVIKNKAAIQAGDSAILSLALPDAHASTITTALALMNFYGALGGRSRNGWGSFSLTPENAATPALPCALEKELLQPWQDALRLDWPHAIGSDQQGALVWQTPTFDNWPALMKELAILKIGLRTQFNFTTGRDNPATTPEARHWLSYPVTNHSVQAWGGNARLPNSLRFKVRPAPNNPQKLVGMIFHMPCLPPPAFNPDPQAIVRVWQTVHGFLDVQTKLSRMPT